MESQPNMVGRFTMGKQTASQESNMKVLEWNGLGNSDAFPRTLKPGLGIARQDKQVPS